MSPCENGNLAPSLRFDQPQRTQSTQSLTMAKGGARTFLLMDLGPLAAGYDPAGTTSNFTSSVSSVVLT